MAISLRYLRLLGRTLPTPTRLPRCARNDKAGTHEETERIETPEAIVIYNKYSRIFCQRHGPKNRGSPRNGGQLKDAQPAFCNLSLRECRQAFVAISLQYLRLLGRTLPTPTRLPRCARNDKAGTHEETERIETPEAIGIYNEYSRIFCQRHGPRNPGAPRNGGQLKDAQPAMARGSGPDG